MSREKAQREANNVLERWAITLADASGRLHREAGGLEPAGGPFWGIALQAAGDPAYRQLVRELTELRPGASPALAQQTAATAKARIRGASPGCGALVFDFTRSQGYLACAGTRLAAGVSGERLGYLADQGGVPAMGAMALRYEILAPGGCQWRFPQEHAVYLYTAHGVRHEGFASPLNANFLGLAGAAYYSLFPDTDRPFGSSGSFFTAPMHLGGGWLLNPPFIESILERAATQVLGALGAPSAEPLTVFFIMPAWVDAAAYRALQGSEYLRAVVDLAPGAYYYETPSGERVHTSAPSRYFALSSVRSEQEVARLQVAISHLGSLAAGPKTASRGAAPRANPHRGREALSGPSRSVRPPRDDGSPGWAAPPCHTKWPWLVPPPSSQQHTARHPTAPTLWPARDSSMGLMGASPT